MVAWLLGRKLMIGVDRLDYSKGPGEPLPGLRALLESQPENPAHSPAGRAVVAHRSRFTRGCAANSSRPPAASTAASAETDWTPIRYLQSRARGADGLLPRGAGRLVTPVRDGMNLVAKEFVAAQDAEDPGVDPVVARRRGRANSALLVNLHDTARHGAGDPGGAVDAAGGAAERHAANLAVRCVATTSPPGNTRDDRGAGITRARGAAARRADGTGRRAPSVVPVEQRQESATERRASTRGLAPTARAAHVARAAGAQPRRGHAAGGTGDGTGTGRAGQARPGSVGADRPLR